MRSVLLLTVPLAVYGAEEVQGNAADASSVNVWIFAIIFVLATIAILQAIGTRWFMALSIRSKFYFGFAAIALLTILALASGVYYTLAGLQTDVETTRKAVTAFLLGVAVLFVTGTLVSTYFARNISAMLQDIIDRLRIGSEEVMSASTQVAKASQQMAGGANDQASSLEESSASLEEMSSMTRNNADNTQKASELAGEASNSANTGSEAMTKLQVVMRDISDSSRQTADIVKTIDNIAFQTNLLALNAAVEAARAGESGRGFAVVAEEVRSLAQRSAEAASHTSLLIEEAQHNADSGVYATEAMGLIFDKIKKAIENVASLAAEVSQASHEQARGIEQINAAVSQMDRVTQSNAATSEESASASEELQNQARDLSVLVARLDGFVRGGTGGQHLSDSQQRTTIIRDGQLVTRSVKTTRKVSRDWNLKQGLETVDECTHDEGVDETRAEDPVGSVNNENADPKSEQKKLPEKVIPLSDEEMKDF